MGRAPGDRCTGDPPEKRAGDRRGVSEVVSRFLQEGRLHRAGTGKCHLRVYDYVESGIPVLARMFGKRGEGYRADGLRGAQSRQ
jgi:hypothetical protein